MKAIIYFLPIIGLVIAQSEKPLQNAPSYRAPEPRSSFPIPRPPPGPHHEVYQGPDGGAIIVRYSNEQDFPNGYKFGFDTSNGISRDEQGTLTNIGTEDEGMEVVGGYEYIDPLKRKVTVTYTAGANGFRPTITYS